MSQIKASEYSKIEKEYKYASSELNGILKYEKLPESLKKEVLALKKKFDEYDIEQHREAGVMLSGEILTAEELKQIVIDATGYTKWNIDTQFDEEEEEFKTDWTYLLKRYGVDVADKSKITEYRISRNVKSRDEIWLIGFTVLPGHVDISYDTGRVGYGEDDLIPNKDIKKLIAAQFD